MPFGNLIERRSDRLKERTIVGCALGRESDTGVVRQGARVGGWQCVPLKFRSGQGAGCIGCIAMEENKKQTQVIRTSNSTGYGIWMTKYLRVMVA